MGHPFVVRLMPEEEEEGKKATRQHGSDSDAKSDTREAALISRRRSHI
jgi:hypothetical protein